MNRFLYCLLQLRAGDRNCLFSEAAYVDVPVATSRTSRCFIEKKVTVVAPKETEQIGGAYPSLTPIHRVTVRNDTTFFLGCGDGDCTLPCKLTAHNQVSGLDEEELGIAHTFFIGSRFFENAAPTVVKAKPN